MMMRAPERPIRWSLDEIVAEIVKEYDQGDVSDPTSNLAIGIDVRATLDLLGTLGHSETPLWGHEKENLRATEGLLERIEGLQTALRTMPGRALYLLFAFGKSGQAGDILTGDDNEKVLARGRRFTAMLNTLHARCRQLMAEPPGKHRNVDYKKQLACDEAWDFMLRHGRRPTNTNADTSLFRKTSNYFYEWMSGTRDQDLEYACRATFKSRKSELFQKNRKIKTH